MPELNHKLHAGRMNKDLDERLVPNGEYRDALNVEVGTSEGSDVGSMQTLMGNMNLSNFIDNFYCVGSIVNEKEDKIYWLMSGVGVDIIAEYSYKTKQVKPVVVDIFTVGTQPGNKSGRTLNFDKSLLVTGINIIDDMLFWTDNYTEPKRINITRCKMGSIDFQTQTQLYIRDVTVNVVSPNKYINSNKPLKHEHITVIRKSPPAAPVLEMQSVTREDENNNFIPGEITTTIDINGNPLQDPSSGEFINNIRLYLNQVPVSSITTWGGGFPKMIFNDPVDFKEGDILLLSMVSVNNTIHEFKIQLGSPMIDTDDPNVPIQEYFECTVTGGNPAWGVNEGVFEVTLEQDKSLFLTKFPRFATRYKYEDGEYSAFSPFTNVAFLPGEFDYLPKEGYNLGMVNNIRFLGVKDFVDERLIPDDVISIDILYKESNSPSVYSVKTIKRTKPDPTGVKHDEWNAKSSDQINTSTSVRTKGFLEVTSEMIHAVLPSNQLLRPWDNVPRKALAQEITGNRVVYGNYLQNYNLSNSNQVGEFGMVFTPEDDIKVNLRVDLKNTSVGDIAPAQYDANYAFEASKWEYGPAKSIKTLRTYQLGVVYIDEFGRETPVFSDSINNKNSKYIEKISADRATRLAAQNLHTYPEWAESFKFFVKETSSEYYNLAMDRWYDAEDGNIWLTFPSSERNKVDLETFLILKKEHDADTFVSEDYRYKILAIENEAPTFVKTERRLVGSFYDDGVVGITGLIGTNTSDFPLPGNQTIKLEQVAFENVGWAQPPPTTAFPPSPGLKGDFYLKDGEFEMRFVSNDGYSDWYSVSSLSWNPSGHYQVFFEKVFGDDVSVTSPITSPLNLGQVYQNIEVQLARKTIIHRPEYDGRFFAKIRKDLSIIDNIVKPASLANKYYYSTNVRKVQYINFSEQKSSTGSSPQNHYAWYGLNPEPWEHYIISTSCNSGTGPGTDGGRMSVGNMGRGEWYWRKASKNDPSTTNQSSSSGWFIDKIEAFRPFDSDFKYFHKGINDWAAKLTMQVPIDYGFLSGDITFYGSYPSLTNVANLGIRPQDVKDWLSEDEFVNEAPLVEGTNTIPTALSGFNNYLGINSVCSPRYILLRDYLDSLGGAGNGAHAEIGCFQENKEPMSGSSGIMPSLGIEGNIIHISHSGIGLGESADNPGGWAWTSKEYNMWHEHMAVTNWADVHVKDIDFINALTTTGSIWRWKEDPGKCVYQTVSYDSTVPDSIPNTNAYFGSDVPITGNLWNRNAGEMFSPMAGPNGEIGIGLYNHVEISDYYRTLMAWDDDQEEYYSVNTNVNDNYGDNLVAFGNPLSGTPTFAPNTILGDNWGDYNNAILSALGWTSVVPMQDAIVTWPPASVTYPPIRSCGAWNAGFLGYQGCNTAFGGGVGHNWPVSFPSNSKYHYEQNASWGNPASGPYSGKWPMKTHRWHDHSNKRRRYQIYAKSLEINTGNPNFPIGQPYPLGQAPAHAAAVNPGIIHGYLPTNDPYLPPHFLDTAGVVTVLPTTTDTLLGSGGEAPGIRPDGMHTGYVQPWTEGGTGSTDYIPQYYTTDNAVAPTLSHIPGTVTWEILSSVSPLGSDEHKQSTNPAIWETEPKETTDLDIYHEVGQIYPINLDLNNIEQFLGPISEDLVENSKITIWNPSTSFKSFSTSGGGSDIRVFGTVNNITPAMGLPSQVCIYLADVNDGSPAFFTDLTGTGIGAISPYDRIMFTRADGSKTETSILSVQQLPGLPYAVFCLDPYVHNFPVTLPWHNCYSFGNGIESDRIRDDYNQVTIDNGPKASTTIDEPYLEERRASGLIYSGIYNSTSGINNLNQFIAAEKITKDLNPIYGSIQKLHTRNTNLLTLCEDKVFKVLANKDALYNSDGSINLTATENVLGQSIPLLGEYGISKNPESFASESYRNYFTDKTRGTVIRLSQDGMTPISDVGMKDYFADSLRGVNRIYGMVDDKKQEYSISLDYKDHNKYDARILGTRNPDIPSSTIVVSADHINTFQVGDLIQGGGIETGAIIESITSVTDPVQGTNLHILLSRTPTTLTSLGLSNPYIFPLVSWDTIITVLRPSNSENTTVSFSELTKGWTSFKSWIAEDGVSLNSEFYTFKRGNLWKHHQDIVPRNYFYNEQYDSSVEVLFNEIPGSVKSFQTLNYEGSQSKITPHVADDDYPDLNLVAGDVLDGEYWDNELKEGWYVSQMYTNMQQADLHEFKEKEGKWFSQIQGVSTEWLSDGTAGNIDTNEFSYQGIDESEAISIIEGGYTSWDCQMIQAGDPAEPARSNCNCRNADYGGWQGWHNGIDNCPIFDGSIPAGMPWSNIYMDNARESIIKEGFKLGNHHLFFSSLGYIAWSAHFPGGGPPPRHNHCQAGFEGGNWFLGVYATQPLQLYKLASGNMQFNKAQDVINWMNSNHNSGLSSTCTYNEFQQANASAGNPLTRLYGSAMAPCICTPAVVAEEDIFSCIEVEGPDGDYATESECLNAVDTPCSTPVPSYTCSRETGLCYDPGDGSGEYADITTCNLDCSDCEEPGISTIITNATITSGSCNNDGTIKITAVTFGNTWGYSIENAITGLGIASDDGIPSNSSTFYNFLSDGAYNLTVTDNLNCTATIPFDIICTATPQDCATSGPYDTHLGMGTSPHDIQVQKIPATNAACDDGGLYVVIGSLGNGATDIVEINLYDQNTTPNLLLDQDTNTHPPFTSTAPIMNLNSVSTPDRPYLLEVIDNMGCPYYYTSYLNCIYQTPTYNCAGGDDNLIGYDANNTPISISPYSCYDPVQWNVSGVPSPGIYTDITAAINNFPNAYAECQADCRDCPGDILNLHGTIINEATCPNCNDGSITVIMNSISTTNNTSWNISYWEKVGNQFIELSNTAQSGLPVPGAPVNAAPVTNLDAGLYEYRIEMSDGCIYKYAFTIACLGCTDILANNTCNGATINDGSCTYTSVGTPWTGCDNQLYPGFNQGEYSYIGPNGMTCGNDPDCTHDPNVCGTYYQHWVGCGNSNAPGGGASAYNAIGPNGLVCAGDPYCHPVCGPPGNISLMYPSGSIPSWWIMSFNWGNFGCDCDANELGCQDSFMGTTYNNMTPVC